MIFSNQELKYRTAYTEIGEQMAKNQKERKNKPEVKYPLRTKINAYGFLHFRNSWLADLGWCKGMPIAVERNSDGSITIRKSEENA